MICWELRTRSDINIDKNVIGPGRMTQNREYFGQMKAHYMLWGIYYTGNKKLHVIDIHRDGCRYSHSDNNVSTWIVACI